MYLWKLWRDSRFLILWSIAGLAVFAALAVFGHVQVSAQNGNNQPVQVAMILGYVQLAPLGFIAWYMGSFGVGRTLGEGAGPFLFTKPRRRRWFLWHDWVYGVVVTAIIVAISNLIVGVVLHRTSGASGGPWSGSMSFNPAASTSILAAVGSNFLMLMLFCVLLFSVTYFFTVLRRHALGILLAIGAVVGYLILAAVIKHYWELITLPSLLLSTYDFDSLHAVQGFSRGLSLSIFLRVLVILAFPVAAQLILENRDI
jgi:hypothetical protein